MISEQQATAARLVDDPRKLLGPIGSFDKHVAWRDEVLEFLRTLAAQPDDAAAGEREAGTYWRRRYEQEYAIVARIWEQLGVTEYTGKSIYEYIAELQECATKVAETALTASEGSARSAPQPVAPQGGTAADGEGG